MKATIVEKTKIDIATGKKSDFFAVVSSQKNPHSIAASLTYEGHITPWFDSRKKAENIYSIIENIIE